MKTKKQKGCTCIQQVNKQLEPHNTYIPTELLMNFKTGKCRNGLLVPTAKLDPKKRGNKKTVIAAHCPICGRKFPRD